MDECAGLVQGQLRARWVFANAEGITASAFAASCDRADLQDPTKRVNRGSSVSLGEHTPRERISAH